MRRVMLIGAATAAIGVGSPLAASEASLEIVVTQEITSARSPDADTARTSIGGKEVQAEGATSVDDLARRVPNLSMATGGPRRGGSQVLRGSAQPNVRSPIAVPSVAVYMDDVPVLSANGLAREFLDLDSVTVARGPQGTRMGHDGIGGVMTFRTRPAPLTARTWVRAGLGDFGYHLLQTGTGGSVADDAQVALAAGQSERRGFTGNRAAGGRIGDRQSRFAHAKLSVQPAPRVAITAAAMAQEDDDGGNVWETTASVHDRPYQADRDAVGWARRRLHAESAKIEHFGSLVDISSVTALQQVRGHMFDDGDMTATPLLTYHWIENQTAVSEEVRIATADRTRSVRWSGGLMAFRQDGAMSTILTYNPQLAIPNEVRSEDVDRDSAAAFGEVAWRPVAALETTAGLRLVTEHQSGWVTNGTSRYSVDQHDVEMLPRLGATWTWTSEHQSFTSLSRGFRAGGMNLLYQGPDAVTYGAETSWNLELGHRVRVGDLSVDASAFHIRFDNKQVEQLGSDLFHSAIRNAPRSSAVGAEMEAEWAVADSLTLTAAAGWIDAHFDDFTDPGTGARHDGKRVPMVPDATYSAGARWARDLDGWTPSAFARVEGVGAAYANASNLSRVAPYALVHLGIGGRWPIGDVALVVRNAMDRRYQTAGLANDASPLGLALPGEPRTVSLTVRADF